jgi:F-type H+-transporting ATPase subunit alpha
MKQKQYAPLSIAEMGVLLYAGNEGYLQDVEVAKIGDFESALLGYMRSECADVMQAIEADGGWDDEREAAFKSAIETFKSTQTW